MHLIRPLLWNVIIWVVSRIELYAHHSTCAYIALESIPWSTIAGSKAMCGGCPILSSHPHCVKVGRPVLLMCWWPWASPCLLWVSSAGGTELSLPCPWERQPSCIRHFAWPFPRPSHVQLLLPQLLREMTTAPPGASAARWGQHGRAGRGNGRSKDTEAWQRGVRLVSQMPVTHVPSCATWVIISLLFKNNFDFLKPTFIFIGEL